jgi:hypothetical protein
VVIHIIPQELKDLLQLDHQVRIYIPGTTNIDTLTDTSKYTHDAIELFSNLFGGATEYQANGGWISSTKGLVIEPVRIIQSFCNSESIKLGLKAVIKFAELIKRELKQESVALEYDGRLILV